MGSSFRHSATHGKTPEAIQFDKFEKKEIDKCHWSELLHIQLGKPSLKKKSVKFFTLGSDPTSLFTGKCNENQKEKKIRPLKCDIKPF